MSATPNFEKLQTITSGYFPYIIGRFHVPDIYVMGVMDLNDPASWSGQETAVIFYFMITPEEYGWLNTDRARLDALAQNIQTNMPKNRLFSATSSKKGASAQELKELCDEATKSDSLEEDAVFEEWKKTVRLPQTIQMPKTPLTEARHALAEYQKGYNAKTATPEQTAEETELEQKLGWLLYKADALYVAMDQSFNPRYPLADPVRAEVRIFSDRQLAEQTIAHYTDNHLHYLSLKTVEKKEIKSFLRQCEALDLKNFRLDDGVESATIALKNIIPELNRGFAENFNSHVRGTMLRTLQALHQLKKHGEEMAEQPKASLNACFMTWNRMMLQELGKTVLYVPCGIPGKLQEKLRRDHVFSPSALEQLKKLMSTRKNMGTTLSHPGFTGREAALNLPVNVSYPARMAKTNDGKQWILAFTGLEEAEEFVRSGKNPDLVIGLTLDELYTMVIRTEAATGVLVDPATFAMSMNQNVLEQALKVREEKVIIYRPEDKSAPKKKAQQDLPFEVREDAAPVPAAPQPPAVPELPPEEPVEPPLEEAAPAQEEQEEAAAPVQEKPEEPEQKGGFFGRLFGRK